RLSDEEALSRFLPGWEMRPQPIRCDDVIENIPATHAAPSVKTNLPRISLHLVESLRHHHSVTPKTIHGSPPSRRHLGTVRILRCDLLGVTMSLRIMNHAALYSGERENG